MERALVIVHLARHMEISFKAGMTSTPDQWLRILNDEPHTLGVTDTALQAWRDRGCRYRDEARMNKWNTMLVCYIFYRLQNDNRPLVYSPDDSSKYRSWARYTIDAYRVQRLNGTKYLIVQQLMQRFGESFFDNGMPPRRVKSEIVDKRATQSVLVPPA